MVVYHDRNLIINYIPRNLSDLDLSNLFSTVGPIKTCRIIRDHNSGSSFGFGFCEYEDPESAHRAIERFNGYRIADKILKVSLAKLQGRLYQSSNLYVKNFPLSVTDEDIAVNFSRFGKVLQCRILRDRETNASKGSAYVLFDNRVDAENAKKALDGFPWPGSSDGQLLAIKFATPPYRQPSVTNQNKFDQHRMAHSCSSEVGGDELPQLALQNKTNLLCDPTNQYFTDQLYGNSSPAVQGTIGAPFVAHPSPNSPGIAWMPDYTSETFGIPPTQVTPTYLPPYVFAQNQAYPSYWPTLQPNMNMQTFGMLYGPQLDGLANAVHGCPVLAGLPNSITNNGLQQTAALRGLLSGLLTEDNNFRKFKNGKSDRNTLASVYVYNIGNLMTERRLSELFGRFGTVVNVSIPRDPKTNFTRNFGFVTFSSMHCAQLAINSMNGFVYDGRRLQVSLRRPKNTVAKNGNTLLSKPMTDPVDSENTSSDAREHDLPLDNDLNETEYKDVTNPEECVDGLSALQLHDVITSESPITNGCPPGIKT